MYKGRTRVIYKVLSLDRKATKTALLSRWSVWKVINTEVMENDPMHPVACIDMR